MLNSLNKYELNFLDRYMVTFIDKFMLTFLDKSILTSLDKYCKLLFMCEKFLGVSPWTNPWCMIVITKCMWIRLGHENKLPKPVYLWIIVNKSWFTIYADLSRQVHANFFGRSTMTFLDRQVYADFFGIVYADFFRIVYAGLFWIIICWPF